MARIRTIKPEFPQSESMGRVSRDARLTFIQMWTLADDAGRLRGSSRMLASLLYPYDDDARALIDGWLAELEHENCIARYSVDGATYIQILKWLSHQRIDHPSPSKLPEFDESSRILANPREPSCLDLEGTKEGTKEGTDVGQKPDDAVGRVFDHWRSEYGHPRAHLDPKRRKVIREALKAYDEATLREAICGYKLSPHHMGQNEQRTVYDDISLFLRDAEHIDRGLGFARAPPPQQQSAVERAREKLLNGVGHGHSDERSKGETGLGEVAGVLRRLTAP